MATARLDLVVGLQGGTQVQSGLASIEKQANATKQALSFMRAALVTIAVAEIVKRFTEMADVFTMMENRLRVLTGAMNGSAQAVNNFKNVSGALIALAMETGTSLDANALLFNRLARAVAGTGETYAGVLVVTRAVAESILISGANSIQAKQGMLQFAEGMGSGVLRGRQLRSVVQDFPALADAIASGFKGAGTGANLLGFALANPNVLKAPLVMKAIEDSAAKIHQEFQTMTFTISQGFELINTATTVFMGNLLNTTSLGSGISNMLRGIANQIPLIIAGFTALAAVIALNIVATQLLSIGMRALAVIEFFATLIPNLIIIGGLIIAIGGGFVLLGGTLSTNANDWSEWAARILVYIEVVLGRLKDFPEIVRESLSKAWNEITDKVPTYVVPKLNLGTGVSDLKSMPHAVDQLINQIYERTINDTKAQEAAQYPALTGLDQAYRNAVIANSPTTIPGGPDERGGVNAGGGVGQLSLGGVIGNTLKPITDLGPGKKLFDAYLKDMTDMIGGFGEKADTAAAKVKGLKQALDQALGLIGQVEPLVKFNTEMSKLSDDLKLAGPQLKALGIDGEEAFNRLAARAAGYGVSLQEMIEQGKVATQQFAASNEPGFKGPAITASALAANLSNIGGTGDLSAIEKMNTDIAFQKNLLDTGQISAQRYALAVRQITSTTTDIDKFNETLAKINKAHETGALDASAYHAALRAAFGDVTPLDTYVLKLLQLNALLESGDLTAQQYAAGILKAQQDLKTATDALDNTFIGGIHQYFDALHTESTNVAGQMKTLMTDAFSGATDALIQFVNTGKINFTSLINSIEADLLKLAMNELADSLIGNGSNTAGGSPNLISALVQYGVGAIFGGLFGGSSLATIGSTSDAMAAAFSSTGLPLMASGGSFDVANGYLGSTPNGIDNRIVAFRANDSEQVTVGPKGASSGVQVNMHIYGVTDAASFGRSKGQILNEMANQLSRAQRRNG